MLAASVLLLALATGPALAHARLLSSDPKGGATVDGAPEQVTLRFNEDIEPDFAQVQITGPDGARIDSGTPTVTGSDVVQPLGAATDGGRYRVAFRVVSADGHPVQSTFSFSLAAPAPRPRAASAAPAPRQAAPAPEPATAQQPAQTSPTASAQSEGGSPLPLILAGVAVVLLLGAAGFVARSRRTEQIG